MTYLDTIAQSVFPNFKMIAPDLLHHFIGHKDIINTFIFNAKIFT